MLKIATWKNDSICPINEKIETDYIEFPVAYFGIDDELFSFHHKLFGFATDFESRFLFLLSPFSSLLKSSLDSSPPNKHTFLCDDIAKYHKHAITVMLSDTKNISGM